MPGIDPLEPLYDAQGGEQPRAIMPPGTPPIALLRVFAKNLPTTRGRRGWGFCELSKEPLPGLRERAIVIDRTCARCRCQHERGGHAAHCAAQARPGRAQLASLSHRGPGDTCWTDQRDRLLTGAAGAPHHTTDVPGPLWGQPAAESSEAEPLVLLMLCGWHHAVTLTARATRLGAGKPGTSVHRDGDASTCCPWGPGA